MGRSVGAGDDGLISAVERAGLAGRGGAGFPAGRKLRAVARAGRRAGPLRSPVGTVVIANGAESEPASRKDRTLLWHAPHLVLDGIALAAEAVGATRAYLCVHGSGDRLADRLTGAISDRERAGLNRVPIQVIAIGGGYVASQETALISRLGGGPGRPAVRPAPAGRARPARPAHPGAERGDPGPARPDRPVRPGVVPGVGTAAEPGSALVTVGGAVHRPGVYEIALGRPVGELLRAGRRPGRATAGDPGRRVLRRLAAAARRR